MTDISRPFDPHYSGHSINGPPNAYDVAAWNSIFPSIIATGRGTCWMSVKPLWSHPIHDFSCRNTAINPYTSQPFPAHGDMQWLISFL